MAVPSFPLIFLDLKRTCVQPHNLVGTALSARAGGTARYCGTLVALTSGRRTCKTLTNAPSPPIRAFLSRADNLLGVIRESMETRLYMRMLVRALLMNH
eukprot:6472233-Amphidinium_carterae.1